MAVSAIRTTKNSGTAASYTLSILVDGTDPALCCATGGGDGVQSARWATGVTWNTTENFTKKWEVDDGAWTGSQGWTLIPSATGTHDVVASFSGADLSSAGVTLFNGVHQTVSFGTAASGGARDTTNSVAISSAAGELVWTSTSTDDETGITAGGTQLWQDAGVGSDNSFGAQTYSGAATVTATWTQDILGWSSGGIALKPTATSAALTGTVTATIGEADIVAGGKTIIATLTGDSWVPTLKTIAYVGGQVGGFAGTTSAQTITFALAGGLAATPAAGDLVIIAYGVGSTADRSLAIRNTGATDYTLIGSEQYINGTFDTNFRVAYRFMPGTPETQFVLTETVSGGTGNIADAGRYSVLVFRNIDTSTPLDVAAVLSSSTTTRIVNPPSITPSTAGAYIAVVGCAAGGTGGTFTSSDLTDFRAGTTADTNDAFNGGGYNQWSSGAFDAAAWGGGGTDVAGNSYACYAIALRPAPYFDTERSNIASGVDSAQSEAAGWDAKVKPNIPVANVVRTSNTVVTITLQAQADYDITAQETITWTIPASAVVGGVAIVASPTFTIDAAGGGGGPAVTSYLTLLGVG